MGLSSFYKYYSFKIDNHSCIGCRICASVCKENAISGIENYPQMIDGKKCKCCGECGSICPVNAIKNLSGSYHSSEEKTIAKVSGSKCGEEKLCGWCDNLCENWIMGEDGIAKINETECIGCGWCVVNCPLNAVKMIFKEKCEV